MEAAGFCTPREQRRATEVEVRRATGGIHAWSVRASQEIPNHLASHIDHKTILWTATISKTKEKEYLQLFKPDYDLHILVMNVEAFSTKKGLEFAAKFINCHNTLMAVDESTTIKTPTAKRTKSICSLGKHAKYKRILTGSPVTKSPLDLYTQCVFLDEELL